MDMQGLTWPSRSLTGLGRDAELEHLGVVQRVPGLLLRDGQLPRAFMSMLKFLSKRSCFISATSAVARSLVTLCAAGVPSRGLVQRRGAARRRLVAVDLAVDGLVTARVAAGQRSVPAFGLADGPARR